jgi:hypothetical protein
MLISAFGAVKVLGKYQMHYWEVLMPGQGTKGAPKKPSRQWRQIIDECVGKALANSFRQQILWILNERTATQSEVARELGESMSKIWHHFKVLKDAKCIEIAHTEAVGNRLVHYYKANSRAFLDDMEWRKVPESLKEGLRATLLSNVIEDSVDSVVEGIFDSLEDSHMSWTPMIIDEQARMEITQILNRALREVIAAQNGAKERLAASDAIGMSYTVSLLGYPATGGEKRVGPPIDAEKLVASAEVKPSTRENAGNKNARSKKRKAKAPKRATPRSNDPKASK